MQLLSQPYDVWEFSGDEETYSTLATTDPSDGGYYNDKPLTVLGSTDHGFKAGSLCYLQGTINYDGIQNIQAVAANTITIYAPFIAEASIDTSDTIKTMVTYDRIVRNKGDKGYAVKPGPPWLLLGFDFTLASACGTVEDFQLIIDAEKGAAWDNNIYTEAMNGVQYINYMFDEARKMESGDKADFTFDNTDNNLWGLKVYTRRLA